MMSLPFFSRKLGASKSRWALTAAFLSPLFLTSVLGMPNYGLRLALAEHMRQLLFGSRRWIPTVPNGSSFPPVASGAKGTLDFYHICSAAVPRSIRRGHVS